MPVRDHIDRYRIDFTFGPNPLPADIDVARVTAEIRAKISRLAELAALDDFGPATKNLRAALRIEANAPMHLRSRAEAITDRIAAGLRDAQDDRIMRSAPPMTFTLTG